MRECCCFFDLAMLCCIDNSPFTCLILHLRRSNITHLTVNTFIISINQVY